MQQNTPDGPPCPGCHRPLKPGARFCTSCGTPVPTVAPVTVVDDAQQRVTTTRRATTRTAVLAPSFGLATPAGLGRRIAAYAIDLAAVAAVAAGVWFAFGHALLVALAVLELGIGLVVWEARTGRTLGNSVLGLRTARVDTPYTIGPRRALLRALPLTAGYLVAGVGEWAVVASAGFDRSGRNQGWHDRAGRAVVVDIRAQERAVTADETQLVAAMSGTPAATRPDPIAVAAPTPPVRQAMPDAFVLTLDTGQAMSVTGPGLIGRIPQPTPGERCDHVIAIEDPERSVSRTHARFGMENGVFWVQDAGSGNGTGLRLPDGHVVAVPVDQRVAVPSDGVILVGERSVRVQNPGR